MTPLLVVHPPTPAPAAAHFEEMLEACSSGLQRGRCVGPDYRPGDGEAVFARAWIRRTKGGGARIELRSDDVVREQRLVFSPEDPDAERWTASGFLVASLVDEIPRFQSKQVEPGDQQGEPRKSESAESAQGTAVKKADTESGYVAAGALLGRAIEGEVAVGGRAQVGVRLPTLPVEGLITIGYSGMPRRDGLALSFAQAELGAAWVLKAPTLNLELRPSLKFAVDHVRAHARVGDFTDQLSRWVIGGAAGGTVSYPSHASWRGVLGGDVLRFSGGTGIEVDGERLGSIPAWNFRAFLGVGRKF